MIESVMVAAQDKLLELYPDPISYLAEDWGQLDYYNERPPVKFPCVLLDIEEVRYSDCTQRVQQYEAILIVRVADFDPVNLSATAPDRNRAFRMFALLQEIYVRLQGLSGEHFSSLTRISLRRVRREDTIREYIMQFRFGGTDNAAYKPGRKAEGVQVDINTERV